MSYIIFDTEYTTWPGCQEHGWRGKQKKEIVQIAAVKVSDRWIVTDTFNHLCQPIINPIVSDYFVQLTGITRDQIQQQGIPFAKAYQEFCSFSDGHLCLSHAWGADYNDPADGNIIAENLNLLGLPINQDLVFRNIAAIFQALYQLKQIPITKQSSGQIARLLGREGNLIKMGIQPHNALYDVFSILEGLQFFQAEIISIDRNTFRLKRP